ncbi:glutathione S-transferase family protein [Rhodovulum sp. DZ06]|uniref:glutathione S-transferase family protein n=1 Tax=Rhodovulum sp. DZ06 TaxID=3425126 RepID=UPI003D340190
MLVDGKWTEDWQPVQKADKDGRFVRQTSAFRNWITPDAAPGPTGTGGFKAEAGRYRLYVALICPWASRTLAARALKGLEDVIAVTVVDPQLTDQGWAFGGRGEADPLHASEFMHGLYTRADPHYTGRATVPVLWDEKQDVMVNNESADILAMLDSAFEGIVSSDLRLRPEGLLDQVEALNADIYDRLNNGVYKAGFASSQKAYDEAVEGVFASLDMLEARLEGQADGPFLFGGAPTETDVRLFVTLVRFDAAYHNIFKCNWKRIADYPRLQAHTEAMLALPGLRGTVNMAHILAGYYSVKALNPTGITPKPPAHVAAMLA